MNDSHFISIAEPLPRYQRHDPEDGQWWPSCECGWNRGQMRGDGTLYFDTEAEAEAVGAEHITSTKKET